jgi:hypothetical protein
VIAACFIAVGLTTGYRGPGKKGLFFLEKAPTPFFAFAAM